MKKIIFTLLALIGTMSMNAQIIVVMKYGQDTPVETYNGSDYYVVFKEAPAFPFGQGEAEAEGIGKVRWVQLWENGPKFAEYNVGAASATEYGGYYTWGGTFKNEQNSWNDDHIDVNSNLSCTGDSITDTATYHWGSNWRMPTKEEFDNLLAKCTVEWTNVNGLNGRKFTGKDAYADNSVFLPAAGDCRYDGVYVQGDCGSYWSSTANGSEYAYNLFFHSVSQDVNITGRSSGYSVRPVLAE